MHTLARAVKMGYNVMALDASSHFSDDPYIYLKAPPLARAALVSMTTGSLKRIVAGQFLYAQNATGNGPVAWVLTESVERVRCRLIRHTCLAVFNPRMHASGPAFSGHQQERVHVVRPPLMRELTSATTAKEASCCCPG